MSYILQGRMTTAPRTSEVPVAPVSQTRARRVRLQRSQAGYLRRPKMRVERSSVLRSKDAEVKHTTGLRRAGAGSGGAASWCCWAARDPTLRPPGAAGVVDPSARPPRAPSAARCSPAVDLARTTPPVLDPSARPPGADPVADPVGTSAREQT